MYLVVLKSHKELLEEQQFKIFQLPALLPHGKLFKQSLLYQTNWLKGCITNKRNSQQFFSGELTHAADLQNQLFLFH